MKRRNVLSKTGALAALALAGCTGGSESPPENAAATPSVTETRTGPSETNDPDSTSSDDGVLDDRLATLAEDNARFALDLHAQLANETGGNLFLSPYSISVALAMAFAGARGETHEQMRETLRYTLGESVHPAFAEMQAVLEDRETATDPIEGGEVGAFQLDVANAIWGQADYPFADDYLALLEDHYGAGLRSANFDADPEGERQRINEWVADATDDRIEDLLPSGSIDASTVLVLTNAIYFVAAWAHQFDPENTETGTFRALDGSKSTVPFMHQGLNAQHASIEGAEAIELPYVGEEVSMVLVLPDEGQFEAFERDFDVDRLYGLFDALSLARGGLAMPKFEFETKVRLKDALSALGMPSAFDAGGDFGGMVDGEDAGVWIQDVFHETFVSVDEHGTEAAAATSAVVGGSAPPSWGELRFDRPFLFCIRDRPTDAVLFQGRIVDAAGVRP